MTLGLSHLACFTSANVASYKMLKRRYRIIWFLKIHKKSLFIQIEKFSRRSLLHEI